MSEKTTPTKYVRFDDDSLLIATDTLKESHRMRSLDGQHYWSEPCLAGSSCATLAALLALAFGRAVVTDTIPDPNKPFEPKEDANE